MEGLELAKRAVEAAGEQQAGEIVLLDARNICGFADYFVICSGQSARQLQAINDEIERVLEEEGVPPYRFEGTADSGWMLLDYGDVIIHIFAHAEREFYQLDKLWSEATPVLRIQ